MSSVSTKWILELVDKITAPLKNIDGSVNNITKDVQGMNAKIKETSAIDISAIAESFRSLNNRLNEFVAPGIKFQDGLAEVEAITGVTGDALEALGSKARKSAKHFGGDASDSLDNYKVILSKLGPDIGQSEIALDAMNNSVLTMSKTMGGDSKASVEALTTSLLQFRVDLTDPIKASTEMTRMMNVMAAGAKEGAAEVPQISQSIKVAGVAASIAKVSFVETNAAIQELAKGGKVGAEAGTGLRNVLTKLSGEDIIPKEALAKLKAYGVDMSIVSDTSLPFTTRLRELGKAQADATAFAQVFGVENSASANILVRSVDAQDALQKKIKGTNVATEQAAVIMGTYSEKMKRMKSFMSDLGISVFNGSKSFLPFINGAFGAIDVLADLKNAQKGVALIMNTKLGRGLKTIAGGFKKGGLAALGFLKNVALSGLTALKASARFVVTALTGIGTFVTSLITATAAQLGLNVAMTANPIGLIVIGIAAAIGAIVLMIKYWDTIKRVIWDFAKFMWKISPFKFLIDLTEKIFPGFKEKVAKVFEYVKNLVLGFWNKIKEVWGGIKSFFGFGDETEKEIKLKVTKTDSGKIIPVADAETSGPIIPSTTPNAPNTANGISGSGSGGGKTISMTLDIKNYFNMAAGNWKESADEMADVIVGKINDRMRDAAIALD
jgi:TP901 family phage tail tape measure protein